MLGFLTEIASLPLRFVRAAGAILAGGRLLRLCLAPVLIGCVAAALCIALAFGLRHELASVFIDASRPWLRALLSWLLFFLSFLLSGVAALLAASIFGSIFIESFIEEVYHRHGVELPASRNLISLIKSTVRAVKDDLIRILYVAICLLLVFLAGLVPFLFFIPPLAGAFLTGASLLDLPLALSGMRLRQRWRVIRAHGSEVLALGAVFLALLLVPFGGILFLPVAYYVAVQKVVGWNKGDGH
jgi:uncharacterized protein involved in cysteine biosynthesis